VAFRSAVQQFLNDGVPPKPPIPLVEPAPAQGKPARKTLRRGDEGDVVKELQKLLRLEDDGKFGPGTEAAVRQFQRDHNMVPDGIVGPKTWTTLDEVQTR